MEKEIQDKTKLSVLYTIGQIAEKFEKDSKEQESTSRILQHQNVTFSKHFLASMTEIVLEKMEDMAEDLSSFAKHAGRKVANADDVYLYARKNKSMVELLQNFEHGNEEEWESRKKKKTSKT